MGRILQMDIFKAVIQKVGGRILQMDIFKVCIQKVGRVGCVPILLELI